MTLRSRLGGGCTAAAALAAVAVLAALAAPAALTGCSVGDGGSASSDPAATASTAAEPSGQRAVPTKLLPLRPGERRVTLRMPEDYTPSAPYGTGTDDYRCFLLDPHLDHNVWLTGTNVLPDNPDVVHHVILFRVPPGKVAAAERLDASMPGEGWTCFGGSGLPGEFRSPDDASWLGAWAPGGAESVTHAGYGIPMAPGTRVVMQVHYNLLAGTEPDRSATQLRVAPATRGLTPLHTYLLPAPVELPCRPAHDEGPLCDRQAAVDDVLERFGPAGNANSFLHLLCGTRAEPSPVTSCTRTVSRPMTVLGAAGHMHLLGRSIRIVANPGTPRARTLLDIPVWDFDNQGLKPIRPVHLEPSDRLKVTCHHVQWLRDRLPAFQGQPEKYVIWGDGTTDEMCLGILQAAFD